MDAVKKDASTVDLFDIILKTKLQALIKTLVKLYFRLLLGSCTAFAYCVYETEVETLPHCFELCKSCGSESFCKKIKAIRLDGLLAPRE
jgi:hypothetical protein